MFFCLLTRPNDVLLLAGDISDDLDVIRHSLFTLRQTFQTVFYIPGNHELWVRGEPGDARYALHDKLLVPGLVGQSVCFTFPYLRVLYCRGLPFQPHTLMPFCCHAGLCTQVS